MADGSAAPDFSDMSQQNPWPALNPQVPQGPMPAQAFGPQMQPGPTTMLGAPMQQPQQPQPSTQPQAPAQPQTAAQPPLSNVGTGGYGGYGGMPADQALPLISQFESNNQNVPNYAYGPSRTASGPYQITDTNWQQYAPQVGINTQQYPTAMSAPRELQQKVATAMYDAQGFAPWAPFNPRLRNYLQQHGISAQGGQGGLDAAGMTPQESQVFQGVTGQMPSAIQQLQNDAQDLRAKYPAYAARIDAITADLEKKMGQYDADIQQQEKALFDIRMQAAGQQQNMDEAITKWAANTPTRQATYAAAMHAAAPLSILAAIGGALTKTNAVGLLGATTGIVTGINSGSEQRYKAAMDEWKTQYQVLTDHNQRVMDTFKTMQEAYKGMADADERAVARARLMTNDQVSAEQLKMNSSLGLLQASQNTVNMLGNAAQAISSIGAARQRMLYPYGMGFGGMMPGMQGGGATGLDQPLSAYNAWQIAEAAGTWGVPVQGGYRNVAPIAAAASQTNPDMTLRQWLQDRVDHKAETGAEIRETGRAAQISGGIQGTVNDMRRLIPEAERLARQMASSRTPWVPLNQLLANADHYSSDPRYAAFVQVNQNILRLYRSLGVGTVGRSTGEERAQAGQEFNTAVGPEAYLAALNAIDYEGYSAAYGFHEATKPQSYRDIEQTPEPTRPSEYSPGAPVGRPRGQAAAPGQAPPPDNDPAGIR